MSCLLLRTIFGCFIALALGFSNRVYGQHDVSIIPQPSFVKREVGFFTLKPSTAIKVDPHNDALKNIALYLADQLKSIYSFAPKVSQTDKTATNSISLTLTAAANLSNNEGYELIVTPTRITVKAKDPAGIFFGIQTLLQLIPTGSSANSQIPAVSILDQPQYPWRGMLLDVGRYFYPVAFIKKFIDYLALHKMNTFHWHLTEDQGWRIEIKKYPRLTQVGAWRKQTLIGHLNQMPHTYDGKLTGGFYTQDQIREIVEYARQRYITVVPEIEMPGHCQAALASYPELSCTGGPFEVSDTWGVHEDVYCAGNEKTFAFLEDVLSEVAELFPSRIIHIGGDECPKTRWKQCAKCQARIKQEGLRDEHELQSYFIKRIEKFLLTKNRNIIGWDEILEGGLAPQAKVMSWRGTEGGIAAAKQHHDVVMTPEQYVYFDHYQADPTNEPLAIGGYTTLEKTYAYNPADKDLTPEELRYIKGAQGTIWTEYISTPDQVEYMMMPRIAALSEVVWSNPDNKSWEDFKKRMEQQYQRYDRLHIHYCRSNYDVQQFVKIDTAKNIAIVLLKTDSYQPTIYYTLDGSEPTTNSIKYEAPFPVREKATVKAAVFRDGQRLGKTSVGSIASVKD